MFDIAFSELVVIGIIALVVIGPKRLPEVARAAGRWAARMRHFVENVKRDLDMELRKDELAELRKVKEQLSETRQLFEQTTHGALAALPSIQPPAAARELVEPAVAATPARPKTRRKSVKKQAAAKRGPHGRAARKPR